ncbi:unnamed protein product [Ceutorhynchus assimilis]|uniref:Vacuolar protein sorting-associated protein 11 homolog n=1 Tax=Ceutorhynchus assimilis TaxID=467358 RepID=A0A9P0DP41_9CUCU|nr:unnamed protein product [Ceutorhynchus assimilis]
MAFLEWRKFNFFSLKPNIDGNRLCDHFKESKITCTSAGNNHLIFGDSLGQISLVSRSWHTVTYRAYEISIELAYQLRNSPLLVTIGHDEPGVNPLIKVWDTSKFDKNGTPFCLRVTKALARQVSALAVNDNLIAVGFTDGSLVLFRGDISRDRSSKQKIFKELQGITGLAFKISANNSFLFVCTEREVVVYNITNKDKEQKHFLDTDGCAKYCNVLADFTQESNFMVARNDAIYCYTSDGKGPCYAVEGEKTILECFRSYLIIVSKSTKKSEDRLTVLDIYNKFIVFQCEMSNIRAIFHEWGSLFVLTRDCKLYHLDEKDLQSKLALLFKKNLYDVAIRIAKSHQYDLDGLVDIFVQYGDHLCDKGDFAGAIEQYIKTIGKLEPSYVIRKFVDSQHLEKLIMYLQALHKQGQATEDHTTLLLNCYTKLNNAIGQQSDSLKEFIQSKDDNYDVDVAIKVCRHGSPAEALMLAKRHKEHDWYIKIQIEDHQKYLEVLEYISNLPFELADHYMKKYGQILVKHLPYESTQFLKRLCTNHDSMLSKSDPEYFIHLFLNNSERLVEFLEHLIGEGCVLSPSVYNTLLEHYLHVWATVEVVSERNKLTQNVLELLQNPDIRLDKSHALVVCNMHSFSEGILYLYEEQKLYQQILRYHIARNDPSSVLACCTRFGHQDPTLWVQTLWSCVRDNKQPSMDLLNEVLTVIAKEKLFSPQLVIDAVGTGNASISLGHMRSYIMNEFQQEIKKTQETSELTKNYQKDTEKLKKRLDELRNGVTRIQGSRCAACHRPLELPNIHFLCGHSFHQHCFQSFSDDENDCPTCQPENKNLIELLKAREYNKDLHETFHFQLDKAHDGFSVAAEYFGRGVFNNYKILIEPESNKPKLDIYKPPITEGRLRIAEGKTPKIVVDQNVTEARLRQSEGRIRPQKNPFDDYDDKMNPFTEDLNPFECDKNLNPFN